MGGPFHIAMILLFICWLYRGHLHSWINVLFSFCVRVCCHRMYGNENKADNSFALSDIPTPIPVRFGMYVRCALGRWPFMFNIDQITSLYDYCVCVYTSFRRCTHTHTHSNSIKGGQLQGLSIHISSVMCKGLYILLLLWPYVDIFWYIFIYNFSGKGGHRTDDTIFTKFHIYSTDISMRRSGGGGAE